MSNANYASPIVTDCTFSANYSSWNYGGDRVGGMVNIKASPVVLNCIFWDDAEVEIVSDPSSSPSVTYSDVRGGYTGTGNIDVDPLFASETDLRLQEGSLCIAAGSNAALPADVADLDSDSDTLEPTPLDLDGNPRVVGDTVDMGAYERQ
jgi:hypothetical protein